MRQKKTFAQAASRQIHRESQGRRNPVGKIYYIYIFCALVFTHPVLYAMSEIRSASATERRAFFSTRNSALHCTGSMVSKSNFRSIYTGSQGSLKCFSLIKGRILHCLLFPRHKQPELASSYCKRLQGIFEAISFLKPDRKLPSQCCLTCLGE